VQKTIIKFYIIACISVLSVLFLSAFIPHNSYAADNRFITPTNSGFTGILSIPDAYTVGNNDTRAGFSMEDPYRKYYLTYGIFPNIEFNGLITEILGAPGFPSAADSGYGYYKDKAFDFKFQFLNESKYLPAMALGINDPYGTALYPSEYLVASKEIYPFDFTVGFGDGRYGSKPLMSSNDGLQIGAITNTAKWLRESMPFFGIQFFPSRTFGLEAEYDPTQYQIQTLDPANWSINFFQNKPVPSHFDYGIVYNPTKNIQLIASYQRGNTICLNADIHFNLARSIIHVFDQPYAEPDYYNYKKETFAGRIRQAMLFYGFSNIGINIDGNRLYIQMENNNFFSDKKSAYMALQTLAKINNGKIRTAHAVIEDDYVPVLEASANLKTLKTALSSIKYSHNLKRFIKVNALDNIKTQNVTTRDNRIFNYGISPSFQTLLNDPSNFFQYNLGIVGYGIVHPWMGGSVILGVGAYPVDNVSSNQSPLSIPVRSDFYLYEKNRMDLSSLMFQQMNGFSDNIYTKFAAGLLENEYGGVNFQTAKVLDRGNLIFELGGSYVKKRSVDDIFGFGDVPDEIPLRHYYTYFFTTVLNFKSIGTSLKIKTGRFLAGDKGVEFFLSKYLNNGIKLSAWVSLTDTNVFPASDPYNRGYHDIGLAISVPLRILDGTESKTVFNYAISPWTRDVAQDVYQYVDLADFLTGKVFADKK
jgi:hypothetical protein